MALITINRNPGRRELRQFGLLFFPAFLVLLGFILLKATGILPLSIALWAIAPISVLLGAVNPAALRWVWIVTLCLTFPIGFVVSHVVIALVYYLVLTPAGLLLRLLKGDPLKRAWDPAAKTYWVKRPPDPPVERYFRQF